MKVILDEKEHLFLETNNSQQENRSWAVDKTIQSCWQMNIYILLIVLYVIYYFRQLRMWSPYPFVLREIHFEVMGNINLRQIQFENILFWIWIKSKHIFNRSNQGCQPYLIWNFLSQQSYTIFDKRINPWKFSGFLIRRFYRAFCVG